MLMMMMTLSGIHCRMSSTWRSVIPMPLAAEDPQILTRFPCLAEIRGGVSHSDLQRELVMHQSRLSKLVDKLLEEKWLRVVPKPGGDRRMRFVQTTPKAVRVMRSVEAELASALNVQSAARPRRKQIAIVPGQMSLLRRTEL
jgi:DNA-binding MarR family transcriptional regulator